MFTMLPTRDQVEFWLFTILCSGLGAFLGAYLKKKGENIATHEDIDRIIDELKATTEATKSIEARFTNETWDRQQRWEMKKEIVLAVTLALTRVNQALVAVAVVLKDWYDTKTPDDSLVKSREETSDDWQKTFVEFNDKRMVASLVCSQETNAALLDAFEEYRSAGSKIFSGQESYSTLSPKLRLVLKMAFAAARSELGMPALSVEALSEITSQSGGSAAAPIPARPAQE